MPMLCDIHWSRLAFGGLLTCGGCCVCNGNIAGRVAHKSWFADMRGVAVSVNGNITRPCSTQVLVR